MNTVPNFRPFHAFNALFDRLAHTVNPNSCDLLVIAGHPRRDLLTTAIRHAIAKHPVLRSQIVTYQGARGWSVPESPLPIDVRFLNLDHDDSVQIDQLLLDQIWSESLPEYTSPVRFNVIQTPTRCYLQTIHTHVYADASSCYKLTEDIANAYGEPSTPAALIDVPDRNLSALIDRPSSLLQKVKLFASDMVSLVRESRSDSAGLASTTTHGPGERRVVRWIFSPEDTLTLRQNARERGTSLHGLFKLAFVKTAHTFNHERGQNNSTLRLWDFFSLRPHMNYRESLYDCLAFIYPQAFDLNTTDEAILDQCNASTQQMRSGGVETYAQRYELFHQLTRYLPSNLFDTLWPRVFNSNIFLTNPGLCPSDLHTFGPHQVLDYVTFPQLFAPAEVMFVFSTFRGSLRVLVMYDEDAFGSKFCADFIDPYLQCLTQIAGLSSQSIHTNPSFAATWNPHQSRAEAS